jgi:hypothetical protein
LSRKTDKIIALIGSILLSILMLIIGVFIIISQNIFHLFNWSSVVAYIFILWALGLTYNLVLTLFGRKNILIRVPEASLAAVGVMLILPGLLVWANPGINIVSSRPAYIWVLVVLFVLGASLLIICGLHWWRRRQALKW